MDLYPAWVEHARWTHPGETVDMHSLRQHRSGVMSAAGPHTDLQLAVTAPPLAL